MARVADPAEAPVPTGDGDSDSEGPEPEHVPYSVFASAGDEPRRRRVDDVVLLGLAALTVLAAALLADDTGDAGPAAVEALDGLLGWLEPLWTAAYGASGLLVAGILGAALVARRWALARDAALGGLLALVIGALVTLAVEDRWPAWSGVLWRADEVTYPSVRLAVVAAVALVALPDLTRPFRYAALAVVGLCALAATVLGEAYPAYVVGGLALGMGVGAGVRLTFGSSAGFPHEQRVLADLRRARHRRGRRVAGPGPAGRGGPLPGRGRGRGQLGGGRVRPRRPRHAAARPGVADAVVSGPGAGGVGHPPRPGRARGPDAVRRGPGRRAGPRGGRRRARPPPATRCWSRPSPTRPRWPRCRPPRSTTPCSRRRGTPHGPCGPRASATVTSTPPRCW